MTAPDAASPSLIATSEDLFLGGALRVRQPLHGYRAGLDAVLLAAACPARAGDRCLDCGAGAGVAGLAVARRVGGAHVTLVERDGALAALAGINAQNNALDHRIRVVVADLTRPLGQLLELSGDAATFDHIIVNPPYYTHGAGTRSAAPLKDGSHAMAAGQLDDWARFAASMARAGGSLTLIHRPDALGEVLSALRLRFGGVLVLPLHPRLDHPASRVLIQATKGSRAGLQILSGRVLHQPDAHAFTAQFDAILRGGAALPMAASGPPPRSGSKIGVREP